jgi:Pyruvate/2-oxoacid:ferredoxin oxidoreductase delta subunit
MGHLTARPALHALQQRLDKMPVGAPAYPALFELLATLFTDDECRLAAAMPLKPARIERIAAAAGMGERRATELIPRMIEKGLVVDLATPDRPTHYFLNPTVVGFFEFTMMRTRDDLDQKKVAQLLWHYIFEDPQQSFLRMLTKGPTFFARPLVHEDALAPDQLAEVLDENRATAIVEQAGAWAEGLCHCRHVQHHLGRGCDFPMDYCLALGTGARYLIGAKIARPVSKERALEILAYSRAHDAVQTLDNVRHRPTFVCNCCKCCCELLHGLRIISDSTHLLSSGFAATIDEQQCNGCAKCVPVCPIDAISTKPAGATPALKGRSKVAVVDAAACLGCGVCHSHCRYKALTMQPSTKRVYTPENNIERMMLQALERGRLGNLFFDDQAKLTHRSLAAVCNTLLRLPPAKQLLASQQLKSDFVGFVQQAAMGRRRKGKRARPQRETP